MLIGIPKEIKNHEYRVGSSPMSVREIVKHGHKVIVETSAGAAVGFSDEQYREAGAEIAASAADVYGRAEMIVKVKEPQESECRMIRENQIIFSYLHLAAEPKLTQMLVEAKAIGIAFETVEAADGSLPLLAPMSEIAGKLSAQAGAACLEKARKGRGVLLGGVPGVEPAKVTVIGGGVSGTNAARVAIGMGANVTILDKSLKRLRYLADIFGSSAKLIYSAEDTIESHVVNSDLVIGAVLIPGASAPKIVCEELVGKMLPGSVVVDIAIDQGGCFKTSRPTTHSNPTYIVDDVVHYCVTNMPGAVARTSTRSLENSILPYVLQLADKGYKKALQDDRGLLCGGLNVYKGHVTYKAIADDLGYDYKDPTTLNL